MTRLAGARQVEQREHLQVAVTLATGALEHVDRDVLPVLQHLWSAGYETSFSCQGGPGPLGPRPEGVSPRTGHCGYISFAHLYPPAAIARHLPWPTSFLRFTFSRAYGSGLPAGTRVEFPPFVEAA